MNHDVFVSYHTLTAQDAADAVVGALEAQGLHCWYASRDAEGRFAGNIRRAIQNSRVFVVLLNEAACKSKHTRSEVALAFDEDDLEIIPLWIANGKLSDDMDYYLHGFNHINAVGSRRSTGIEELTRRVLKYLGRTYVSHIETIHYDDGVVYTGQILNGKRHGKGKLVWPNGDVYEGDWRDDQCTGKGKYTWGKGSQWAGDAYEGDFVDGKRTGKGKYTWSKGSQGTGDVYEGDFVDDQRTGYGTYTYSSGKVESGRFENGKYLGK